MTELQVRLKKGRDASLRRRHPWVFKGAVAAGPGDAGPGETVDVISSSGEWLARGCWSPTSQIAVRAWTFEADEAVDGGFFRRRLAAAVERRRLRLAAPAGAARLVHGESDALPGVIVDRFGAVLVVQLGTAGADRHRREILDGLEEVAAGAGLGTPSIWERSGVDSRAKEGLSPRVGLARGTEPPERIEIEEDGRSFLVDVRDGHKTGFYLDQRVNRSTLRDLVSEHGGASGAPRVLDAFCYSGGFTLAALQGGAEHVTQLDASAAALTASRANLTTNGFAEDRVTQILGNAFGELRALRAAGASFDVIVLDPPKFAESKARVERAARGYKDINLLAFQLLRPGGLLMTFSCSGRLKAELFQKIVADAALDAGRFAQILHRLGPGADHPVSLAFPEGDYLKGLVCRAS